MPLGLFTYLVGVFFWVSHKVLSIHSVGLASLVSIQHPMGPGLIHSLQGNGDGTVTPKWSGERGATAVSETEICMSGSPASALLWTEYFAAYELSPWWQLLRSKMHQVNGKEIQRHPEPVTLHAPKLGHLDSIKPKIYLGSGPTESVIFKSGSRTGPGWLRCLITAFTHPLLTMCNCLFIHKVKCNNLKMLKQLQWANRKNYN